jgi:hypothetical protein
MSVLETKNTALVMFRINNYKKEKQIISLCRKMGFMTRSIKPADADRSLSILSASGGMQKNNMALSKSVKSKAPSGYIMPEIIIFSGLTEDKLDGFLKEYKDCGIEPVELKAVVTPSNISWSIYELICELEKEHNAFTNQN